MSEENLSILQRQISDVVDRWVSTVLKDRLMHATNSPQQRSLWDKFKHGVANWWYGPQGQDANPYRWRNRFGNDLGVSETFDPSLFTLKEYSDIRGLVDSVERRMDESEEFDNLKIAQILRSAAQELKVMLFDAMKQNIAYASDSVGAERPAGRTVSTSRVRRQEKDKPAAGPSRRATEEGGPRARRERRRRSDSSDIAIKSGNAGSYAAPSDTKVSASEDAAEIDGSAEGGVSTASAVTAPAAASKSADKSLVGLPRRERDRADADDRTENPELMPYVEKNGVKSLRRTGEKVAKFLVDLSAGNESKKKELLSWWHRAWEDNKKISNTAERFEDIKARLVSKSGWLEEIANISGSTAEDVKKAMVEFIKKDEDQ